MLRARVRVRDGISGGLELAGPVLLHELSEAAHVAEHHRLAEREAREQDGARALTGRGLVAADASTLETLSARLSGTTISTLSVRPLP